MRCARPVVVVGRGSAYVVAIVVDEGGLCQGDGINKILPMSSR